MSIILRLSLSYYLVKAIFYSNGFDACNILRRKIKKRFPERNHEKRFNSVIMKGITCVDLAEKTCLQNKDKKRKRDQTLHMGATKMAPSQNCGSFLCKRSATAPPMDSPIKNLILFLYSSFSAVLIIHRTKKKKKDNFIDKHIHQATNRPRHGLENMFNETTSVAGTKLTSK